MSYINRYFQQQVKRKGFNPNQPRDPAGMSTGGRWTSRGTTDFGKDIPDTDDVVFEKRMEELHDWAMDEWSGWANSVNSYERDALHSYFDDLGYQEVNSYLRHGYTSEWPEEEAEGLVSLIDSALDKSSLPRDLILYRGMGQGKALRSLKAGDVYQDKTYSSTSLHPRPASVFGPVIARIRAPKGLRGAYMDAIAPGISSEFEVLLQRGVKFKVTGRNEQFVDLEVIP